MDVWPMLTREVILLKLEGESDFRKLYENVREMVRARPDPTREQRVSAHQFVGVRMIRRVAFVTADEYKLKIGGSLGEPGYPALVSLAGYDRTVREGCILEIADLPDNILFEEVEIFSESGRMFEIELLNASMTFRREQPAERFQQSVDAMVGKRVNSMRGGVGTGLQASVLIQQHAARQAQLSLANAAATDGQQHSVEQASHTTLLDDGFNDIGAKRPGPVAKAGPARAQKRFKAGSFSGGAAPGTPSAPACRRGGGGGGGGGIPVDLGSILGDPGTLAGTSIPGTPAFAASSPPAAPGSPLLGGCAASASGVTVSIHGNNVYPVQVMSGVKLGRTINGVLL